MTARSLHPDHPCAIDVIISPNGIRVTARCRCGADLGPTIMLRPTATAGDRDKVWKRCFKAIRDHERSVGIE